MRRAALLAALLLAGAAASAPAQSGALRGSVSDSATGSALVGARLEVTGRRGSAVTYSDVHGRFLIGWPGGSPITIAVSRIGYAPWRQPIDSSAAELNVVLAALRVPLDPILVSASRAEEAASSAPASASVVDHDRIASGGSLTPVENVRTVTGMDLASKGLVQHTFAVRGERGSVSGALLMLTDYRNADVPSIAVNVPYLMATTDDDVDRIEVVRGPGAALYGPGADRGVLHVITRSPFESTGGTLTLTAGGRSLFEGTVRYAARLGRTLAFKVSADYLTGRDWSYTDSVEAGTRADSIAAGALPDTLRIGRRYADATRAGGELRLDWRPDARTELVTIAGTADAIHIVELGSDVGSVQARGWSYSYLQTRLHRDRLVANVFANFGQTGDSYLLRNGHGLVDSSRVVVGQLQYGSRLGPLDLTYGADARWTDPRTGGTINGEHEDNDRMLETGAYAHATVAAGPRLDLVAALRADHHSRLDDMAVSPRVGVVYRPSPGHALRLTWNRAFTSPDANTLFADLPVGGAAPYLVRAGSIPQGGYTFRRDCGGLCMYSPFAADPTAPMATDATLLWARLCAVIAPVCGIPAPTAAQVPTNLALLDPITQSFVPVSAASVTDIPALRRTITNAIEAGWKGQFQERLGVALDLYLNRVSDPLGARYAATPNAFFDGGALTSYLAGYLPLAQAIQLASAVAGTPVGTIAPQQTGHTTDILVLSRQGGAYTIWGADLALDVRLSDEVTAVANASWLSRNVLATGSAADTAVLGVPRRKAALELDYRRPATGLTAGLAARWVEGFPVNSGVYAGNVASYGIVDARMGFGIPGLPRTTMILEATNLLDNRHQEFVGAPAIGRLIVTRLRTEF